LTATSGTGTNGDSSEQGAKGYHWVEGKYRKQDFATFTARFYVPRETWCPQTAEDKSGEKGTLVEGSCIEVNRGCFIATASFGSELDPHVQLLRKFRDEVLLQSDLKEAFSKVLEGYYHFSPPVATAMGKREGIRLLLKWAVVYPVFLFVKGFVWFLKLTHGNWS